MSRHQNSFLYPLPTPQNRPLGPKTPKDPQIKSNSKIRIQGNIENTSWPTAREDPKDKVFDVTWTPKIAHFGLKKRPKRTKI